MQITLDIPDDLAAHAIPAGQDPARALLEALALEGYRSHQLSEPQVSRLLGYETPMQVHELLKKHNTYLHYSLEDLEQDRATLAEFFGDSPLQRAG